MIICHSIMSGVKDKGKFCLKYLEARKRSAYRKYPRHGSKVKKSLKFNDEGAENLRAGQGSHDDGNDRFWRHPPPPPPLTVMDRQTTVNRRSLRLRTKKFPISQIADQSSPELLANPTTNYWRKDHDTRIRNVHNSDYGTASDCSSSLYFQPADGNTDGSLVRPPPPPTDAKLSGNHSLGYSSDLDDVMSNLSIDEGKCADNRRFESDDDDLEEDTNDKHLSLKDVKLSDIRASLQVHQNIYLLTPSQGYEITCVGRPSTNHDKNNNNSRSTHYDLRRRASSTPQLEEIISIETFDVDIENGFWKSGLRVFQVSPIISIQPHGVKFCSLYPAWVHIPMALNPSSGDEVYCLYSRSSVDDVVNNCSNIPWSLAVKCSIKGGKVNFDTFQFGLFVLVIRPKCPHSVKNIRSRVGGKLTLPDFPHVEVTFPKDVTEEALLKAEAKIYLDTEESVSDFLNHNKLQSSQQPSTAMEMDCLASPIIQLEPHGIKFTGEPVLITLPIPDYERIMTDYGPRAKLSIWESSTNSNEPSNWRKLDVQYEIGQSKIDGEIMTVVTFPVTHFSFFKGVWEAISEYLYSAKIGMFCYFVSFAMKCQANMQEYSNQTGCSSSRAALEEAEVEANKPAEGGKRFGLEVIVFQADKPWPPMATYKYKVGQSNAKLVKPGKVCVRLKSHYFEADVQAGEEEELVKEEPDFRGRDFEHQFICKFKSDVSIDRGPFGKVLVTRSMSPRQKKQTIFEFNLQKEGIEGKNEKEDKEKEKSMVMIALTELANNLFVTEGENWKQFAVEIGMTKQELFQLQVEKESNPFEKIVSYYSQRGGTTQELIDALHRCHRTLRLHGQYSSQGSIHTSSQGSSGRGSLSSNNAHFSRIGSHDSDTSGTQTSRDSGLPPGRKRSHHSSSHASLRGSGVSSLGSKQAKRRRIEPGSSVKLSSQRNSDADIDSSSDSDKGSCLQSIVSQELLTSKSRMPLENQFLWSISEHINNANWRALGRTLGVDEAVLLEVDNAHSKVSFRECAYQMLLAWKQRFPKKCLYGVLHAALEKEQMKEAAKKMRYIDLEPSV